MTSLLGGIPVAGDALGGGADPLGGLGLGGGGGGGGPLGGLGGALPGGIGDALPGGLGDTLGGATDLAGGLLGGGEGLNLVGLVGIGSDDPALLDLNPSEKKAVKAKKAADAARNKQKRDAAMKKLQEQAQKQGGATPEQQAMMKKLQEDQAKDDAEMRVLDQKLGETDPELFQQAMSGTSSTAVEQAGPSPGLMYAYLVNGQTYQPTHVVTFANASAANTWAASQPDLERVGPQMYSYTGQVPRPSGKGMMFMPIQTVQPILPLQRADGYPICCKQAGGSSAAAGSSSAYRPAPAPVPPPRKIPTHKDFAESHADQAIAKGDTRPRDVIVKEALQDLADGCAQSNGGRPCGSSATAATAASNAYAPASSNGPAGGVGSNATSAVPGNAAQSGQNGADPLGNLLGGAAGGGGGDLLGGLSGGLLGGGQGLNVAGLLAIGSDDKALLDLNPAEKKQAKLQKAQQLKQQQQIQQQQAAALQRQISAQGGQPTPAQKAQQEELAKRNAALNQSANNLRESMRKDEEQQKGLTDSLPGGDLTKSLPTDSATNALPTSALPTNALGGATSSLPVVGGGGGALPGGFL